MKKFLKSLILSKHNIIGAPTGFSCRQKNYIDVFNILSEIVEAKGFKYIDTPMFDFFEVYEKILGTPSTKELFVVKDENNEFLVPRYDITTQIVRFLAPRINNLELPIKLYYFGDIFRSSESEWHKKQVKQFGVEIIGSNEEEEIISLLKNLLEKLNKLKIIEEYKVVFNFASVIEGLTEEFDKEEKELVLELIRVKDTTSIKKFFNGKGNTISKIFEYSLYKSTKEVFKFVSDLIDLNSNTKENFNTLGKYFGENIIFDPLFVPSMDYYNGVYFVVYASNYTTPIATGGRYDYLTQRFNYDEKAMGFAIEVF